MSGQTPASKKKPSKADPSRAARSGEYDYKKKFYQSQEVVDDYDFHRFSTPERQRRNEKKWATINKGLDLTSKVRSILDIPCGTGRFTGRLAAKGYRVVGSDISHAMTVKAAESVEGQKGVPGFIQGDAERLPFPDRAFDCVMSIRFMFHVDAETRVRILREMGRVSRRWLIIDYRHRYTYKWLIWRIKKALGRTDKIMRRVTRQELEHEFRSAGLSVKRVIPVQLLFSDKWIVVAEAPSSARLGH